MCIIKGCLGTLFVNSTVFAKTVLTLLGKVEHCTLLGLYGGVFCNNELFTQTFTDCIKAIYPQIETRLLKVAPEESALRLAREL